MNEERMETENVERRNRIKKHKNENKGQNNNKKEDKSKTPKHKICRCLVNGRRMNKIN